MSLQNSVVGTRRFRGLTTWTMSSGAALALLFNSASAFATDGEATRAIKAASASLRLDQRELPVVERQPTGRDETIKRVSTIAKRLLAKSTLIDGRVPIEPNCQGADCKNQFAAPTVFGKGRWQDGFDPGVASRVRAGLNRGQRMNMPDGVEIQESEDGTLIQRPGIFSLRVFGNGDSFRWVNHLNGHSKHANSRLDLDIKGAEALGRKIIGDLALVELGPDEELLFIKAQQLRFTGKDADPGDRPVGASILFGRLVNGVPVVGVKGSTIKIDVLAEGDIHALSVDWSPLLVDRAAKRQRFAPSAQVQQRIASMSPNATALACGYVDRGGGPRKNPGENGEALPLGCLVEDLVAHERFIVEADEASTSTDGPIAPGVVQQGTTAKHQGSNALGGEDAESASSPSACSVSVAGGARWRSEYLLAAGALAMFGFRRRRWARRGLPLMLTLIGLSWAGGAQAATYSTAMHKNYGNNWQTAFNSTQWTNYFDWLEEMDDIATCVACGVPNQLGADWLYQTNSVWASDLIAVATHATNNSNPAFWLGSFSSFAENSYAQSWGIEAPAAQAGKTEIMLFFGCSAMSTDSAAEWAGYRNAFRHGNHVIAGCWGPAGAGTCSLTDTGINTTFNEIGDELADSSSTVYFAWEEGFSVAWADDKVIIYGSGKRANADCDNVASGVSWYNRDQYVDYQFGKNEPWGGTYEVCGYYWTNL
jgi:MYXO-CTERM domain-containing protein